MTQICKKCIMDDTIVDLTFDVEGVCNYCEEFNFYLSKDGAKETSISSMDALVSRIKSNGRKKLYDCIVGVSGGVDSSWVLYRAKQLGLRPLAVHMDNGWNSELAQNNIEGLVRALDVDLHTHVINWPEYKGLMQAFFDADVIDVELLYDNAMLGLNYRLARKYRIKWILAGTNKSTEGMRMPPNWNWLKYDRRNISAIARKSNVSLKTFPAISVLGYVWNQYIARFRWVSFLDFEDYNKEAALSVLEKECGYKRYPYKHYESVFTRFYQAVILPRKFDVDKRLLHLSTLITSGQMDREDALDVMKTPAYPDPNQAQIDKEYFLKKMNWSEQDLESYLARKPVPHDYYPSELGRWNFLRAVFRRVKQFVG